LPGARVVRLEMVTDSSRRITIGPADAGPDDRR